MSTGRKEFHTFCASRRRAAVADREAAARYLDLATLSDEPGYWQRRASEAITSAISNERDIENRLRGIK